MITVIMPVYNRENIVQTALDSLIKQTYQNFEVVIIDDGSTDGTQEKIKGYLNTQYRYIYQKNSGVSVARNKGITKAKGEYICFLDSDDYFESTFLEHMYKSIKDRSYDVCYCGYFKVYPSKREKVKTIFKSEEILSEYILGSVNVHTTGWMIRRDLIECHSIKFSENVSWGEDVEFFCKILSKTKKVCYCNEYLTNYTVDTNDNRLSSFSIGKIDKDFEYINRLLKMDEIKNNKKIRNALIDYRLSALISYRLIYAYQNNIDDATILKYFNKYRNLIVRFSFNNGLRSIKLNLYKVRLLYYIRRINKNNNFF